MSKFASWNVNGIRACHKNGFFDWLSKSDFDVVCLQEVRATEDQIPPPLVESGAYSKVWYSAQRKGYSGVGILSRVPPKKVTRGMGIAEFDDEGRVIAAEFSGVIVVSAYFPNSQDAGTRIAYKIRFCEAIHKYVNGLRELGKPVILTGDFNIAHQPIDLARPKENEKNAGYLPEEREWMDSFLKSGWCDTFRCQYPTEVAYSWWSARLRARERNVGWRIDYHVVADQDRKLIKNAGIEQSVMGSDHCPVALELDVKL